MPRTPEDEPVESWEVAVSFPLPERVSAVSILLQKALRYAPETTVALKGDSSPGTAVSGAFSLGFRIFVSPTYGELSGALLVEAPLTYSYVFR